VLIINDAATIAIEGNTEAVAVEQMTVYPDNRAVITVSILRAGDLTQIFNFTLNCQLGDAIQFDYHSRGFFI
jgi:hypothetical protein